jgi:hypothetical protein
MVGSSGHIKPRRRQAHQSTVAIESLFLSCVIDAKEG